MQTVRNIQGTKDAGYKWYQPLARIFKRLGMKSNSTCKGIWLWEFEGEKNYLALSTDDILIVSKSNKFIQALKIKFDIYFTYTVK